MIKKVKKLISCLLIVVLLAGCVSVKVPGDLKTAAFKRHNIDISECDYSIKATFDGKASTEYDQKKVLTNSEIKEAFGRNANLNVDHADFKIKKVAVEMSFKNNQALASFLMFISLAAALPFSAIKVKCSVDTIMNYDLYDMQDNFIESRSVKTHVFGSYAGWFIARYMFGEETMIEMKEESINAATILLMKDINNLNT